MIIPMDVIINTLEAQDVLLPYEFHLVKSHASLIEQNQSFLDSLMRKPPDMFYTFCSIMEGLPGYEYIGRYLRAEMKDVDPTVPFDEKVEYLFMCILWHTCLCCVCVCSDCVTMCFLNLLITHCCKCYIITVLSFHLYRSSTCTAL